MQAEIIHRGPGLKRSVYPSASCPTPPDRPKGIASSPFSRPLGRPSPSATYCSSSIITHFGSRPGCMRGTKPANWILRFCHRRLDPCVLARCYIRTVVARASRSETTVYILYIRMITQLAIHLPAEVAAPAYRTVPAVWRYQFA